MSDFGNQRFPVAAKDHKCEWCGERIPKGEKHIQYSGVWEGEFQSWRMHHECHEIAHLNGELADGFYPHEHERPERGTGTGGTT